MLDALMAWSAILLPIVIAVVGYRLATLPTPQPGIARALIVAGIINSAIFGWHHGRINAGSDETVRELHDELDQQRETIAAQVVQLQTLTRQLDGQKPVAAPRRANRASLDPVNVPLPEMKSDPAPVEHARAKAKPGESPVREDLAHYLASGKQLRDRCLTDPPGSSLDREADRWFADVLSFLRSSMRASDISEFMNPHAPGAVPEGIAEDRVPLWRGLDQRLEALNRLQGKLRG